MKGVTEEDELEENVIIVGDFVGDDAPLRVSEEDDDEAPLAAAGATGKGGR